MFADCVVAAGFKTASPQPLAGQAKHGDFFAFAQDGIDGVVVRVHNIKPPKLMIKEKR